MHHTSITLYHKSVTKHHPPSPSHHTSIIHHHKHGTQISAAATNHTSITHYQHSIAEALLSIVRASQKNHLTSTYLRQKQHTPSLLLSHLILNFHQDFAIATPAIISSAHQHHTSSPTCHKASPTITIMSVKHHPPLQATRHKYPHWQHAIQLILIFNIASQKRYSA